MKRSDQRTLQSFRRANAWLGERPEFTGAASSLDSAFGRQVAELRDVTKELTAQAAVQDGAARASRGATEEARRARTELLKYQMQHVSDIAKAAIPDVVKMTLAFRMPANAPSTERLLASAEAMATAAEQYTKTLVERGLPADFVAQLRNAARSYRAAFDSRGAHLLSLRSRLPITNSASLIC